MPDAAAVTRELYLVHLEVPAVPPAPGSPARFQCCHTEPTNGHDPRCTREKRAGRIEAAITKMGMAIHGGVRALRVDELVDLRGTDEARWLREWLNLNTPLDPYDDEEQVWIDMLPFAAIIQAGVVRAMRVRSLRFRLREAAARCVSFLVRRGPR